MTTTNHLVHGLAGDDIAPDWPALTDAEIDALLALFPGAGKRKAIQWHSPRPLSAACIVQTDSGRRFVKRHHHSVRTVATLGEEHRFHHHLLAQGAPLPKLWRTTAGHTAVAMGHWTYELADCADGLDIYRDAISWSPLASRAHAITAGAMLAQLHNAADGYSAAQRTTHILVARAELILAPDPIAEMKRQRAHRPGVEAYLAGRSWKEDFAEVLLPLHAKVQRALAAQPTLWTHGDWHVSNLCWSGTADGAAITAVLDLGLCASTFALFDLATAIERNAIAWLEIDHGAASHPSIALGLIEGYTRYRPLSPDQLATLADLLPIVHIDFALSEIDYFEAVLHSRTSADVAYDAFLLGHARWFATAEGQALLATIRHAGI